MAVEIYPGCEYCGNGLVVSLHLFSPSQVDEYMLEPEGKFEPDEDGYAVKHFPLVGKDDLVEAAKRMNADAEFGGEGYDSFTDWLSDNGLELLQEALRIRQAKTENSS